VALHENPTDGMMVLDVRTPAEFADGHLEGAVLVDFTAPDFRERLEDLDPETPYLMYCRSGNRSGQARAVMAELGFVDVADIEGGTLAWAAAGHPLVTGS
jgi:rhodanese-related sulfurtransferase